MTLATVAAIESRDQRIAQLERRMEERENTVSLMADELALLAVKCAQMREELRGVRARVRVPREHGFEGYGMETKTGRPVAVPPHGRRVEVRG